MRLRGFVTLGGIVAALIVAASCSLATGLDDFTIETVCVSPEDCPGQDTECAIRRCVDGACLLDPLPQYTPCATGECDGAGECRASRGSPCIEATACASGHCTDGLCCDAPCTDTCLECLSTPGTCSPVAAALPDAGCMDPAVCDGAGLCSEGEVLGAAMVVSPNADSLTLGLASAEDGFFSCGRLGGVVTFGGEPQPFGGPTADPYTARFGVDGEPTWIDVIADAQEAQCEALVAIEDGPIIHAGWYSGSITLAGDSVAGLGGASIYVLALDPSTGDHIWGEGFVGASGGAQAWALAVDGTDVLLGGFITSPTDFQTGAVGTAGSRNAVLVRMDGATGTTRWARAFDSPGVDQIRGVTVDGEGDIVIVGETSDALDFGNGPIESSLDGSDDVFVAKLRNEESPVWSRSFISAGAAARAKGVATDEAGDVYVAGWFRGALRLDQVTLPLVGNPVDGFVAKLDGETGDVVWARSVGGAQSRALDVDVDESGHVLVTGAVQGTASFGGQSSFTAVGAQDAFVTAYTGGGELLWTRSLGVEAAFQEGYAVVSHPGRVVMGGHFNTALSAGGTLLATGPSLSPFVAWLTP